MRVIDLGGGHDEDYNDEIYDRRGGRGRSVRDSMNARTRCIAGDGSVSAASVTSTKVLNRICAGDAGVVITEEQTPMTRIISGI